MNPAKNLLQKAVEILHSGNSGVICLPENPSQDTLAAGLSLYLGLTKLGKNVTIACSSPTQSELIGSDKIQSMIATSGNNLVISFPYNDGSIDKIDYYIQGNSFNIVVIPSSEGLRLEPKQVQYSHSGGAIEFIITIDADSLKRFGALYEDNQELFQKNKIINIDRHLTNMFFGGANLVYRTASSTSEIIFEFLNAIKCPLDKDIATNLYAGIVAATKNFSSYSANAQTFELAAQLLKLGAKKRLTGKQQAGLDPNGFISQQGPEFEKQVKPIEEVEQEVQAEKATSSDVLKPKIFKPGTGESA